MELIATGFTDLVILKPNLFGDNRGYFYESFNKQTLKKLGINCNFVQDNESSSRYGVIRGLHYQLVPFSQSKLVRVLEGEIYYVAVDLRIGSPTYGKCFGTNLSSENKLQLFIPQGFAHGFSVLSALAVVLYKTDDLYKKEAERGILFSDPTLSIDWKLAQGDIIVSDRDLQLPEFKNAEANFIL
jgi:dTDP-4-dehydrorhamnose 3,5-epimerase